MAKVVTTTNDDPVQEEILRAALQLYQKFGTRGITMDDLATATGRSRSSLYYYYKSHDEIFQAVLDTIVKNIAVEIRQAVAGAKTVNDKIYTFCIAKLKASENWKEVLHAMWSSINVEEQSKKTKDISALHKKIMHQEGIIVKEILASAISKKEIRPITVTEQDMLTFIISSGMRGIRDEIAYHSAPHNIKEAMRMVTDMVTSWLKG